MFLLLFSLQAGTIHSDIEKGFIRAETYSVGDLVEHGTVEKIKAAGKMRSEGRDYVMKPEDVVNFLFFDPWPLVSHTEGIEFVVFISRDPDGLTRGGIELPVGDTVS